MNSSIRATSIPGAIFSSLWKKPPIMCFLTYIQIFPFRLICLSLRPRQPTNSKTYSSPWAVLRNVLFPLRSYLAKWNKTNPLLVLSVARCPVTIGENVNTFHKFTPRMIATGVPLPVSCISMPYVWNIPPCSRLKSMAKGAPGMGFPCLSIDWM